MWYAVIAGCLLEYVSISFAILKSELGNLSSVRLDAECQFLSLAGILLRGEATLTRVKEKPSHTMMQPPSCFTVWKFVLGDLELKFCILHGFFQHKISLLTWLPFSHGTICGCSRVTVEDRLNRALLDV